MKKLTRAEWSKTPYAGSTAKDSDAALIALLTRYRITTHQITHHLGNQGRPAITLRFVFRDKPYRITGESMDVMGADSAQLIRQCKRWIFWYLKGLLELVDYFGPAEQLMLGFLESGDGGTVYQSILPHIKEMPSGAKLLDIVRRDAPRRLSLPGPPVEGEIVE